MRKSFLVNKIFCQRKWDNFDCKSFIHNKIKKRFLKIIGNVFVKTKGKNRGRRGIDTFIHRFIFIDDVRKILEIYKIPEQVSFYFPLDCVWGDMKCWRSDGVVIILRLVTSSLPLSPASQPRGEHQSQVRQCNLISRTDGCFLFHFLYPTTNYRNSYTIF